MTMLSSILTRLRGLLQRPRVGRELDDELRFHVEMEIRSHIERGLSPIEARRLALRDLGGVDQAKEAIRDVRATWVDSFWQDVRYAFRSLRRRPGAGVAAIGMLGLAIGITTAMFTIVDALILRPAPFRAPDELAFIYMGGEHGGRTTVSSAVLRAWKASPAFEGAESAVAGIALLEANGSVLTRGIARVTPGVFDLLGGIRPIRGRLFEPSEGAEGSDDRVLLSEDLWRSLYGADESLIGRRVTIDAQSLVVVGVLPAEFRFPSWNTVIWRAGHFAKGTAEADGMRPQVYVRFGRNMPRPDALRIATDAARAADATNAKLRPWVQPLAGMVLDSYYQRAVPLLAGGVVLVFLVLCANVSSLLLARLTTRRREFSMRSALGASRQRLMRQAFVESCLLGALGVAVGIGIGWTLVSLSRAFLPQAFLLRTLNPLNIDVRALAVTSVSGIVATLVAGLLPAWIGTRVDADSSLRVSDRGGTETRAARALTRALLVGEIALACTLLVGATLLVRSFINLTRAERGLDTNDVLTATMSLSGPAFPFDDRASRAAAARLLEEQVRALPGVQQVAWSYGLPPGGGATHFGLWQSDVPDAAAADMEVEQYYVDPEFFALYGLPVRGRTFQPSDSSGDVIVGEGLAHALWPGLDPIGRDFTFERETRFHVIGVVREIHHPSLDARNDRPEFYGPLGGVRNLAMLSVRCGGPCPPVAVVRKRLVEAHPAVRVTGVRLLDDVYFEELARPRASAALGFAFAIIAVLAAAGGLFSVLSYAAGRRRREFGIRTALGASPSQIRRLVLHDGMVVALTGIGLGAVAAWSLARTLASLQYGVTMTDPLSWVAVLALLGVTTLAASWQPARAAAGSDPVLLLRED
jgi:putative ABC transport system permease protein